MTKVGLRAAEHVRGTENPFAKQMSLARSAERAGYDGIFFGDRLLASVSDSVGDIYTATASDIIVTLSAVAAVTQRISLGPLVLVAPFRHPVLLAKTLASLDLLSDGRLILPLGAGWNEKEFRTVGIERSGATPRLTESIEILRLLLTGKPVDYQGRYYRLEQTQIAPIGPRLGAPPIWLGSYMPMGSISLDDEKRAKWQRLAQRIGTTADAWVPLLYSQYLKRKVQPETLGEMWTLARGAAGQAGRDLSFVFSQHIYVLERGSDRPRLEQALGRFFNGGPELGANTYLIGSAEEIVAQVRDLVQHIPQVEWFILSLLEPSTRQFRLVTEKIMPQLREYKLPPRRPPAQWSRESLNPGIRPAYRSTIYLTND
jgi:alkanesulfonate monooxygenase SsuD/methylene tetrahydromethanopterin reductase-like flavin-dependent oxidoreductase (luciferase family)